jgi:hypothetical protein
VSSARGREPRTDTWRTLVHERELDDDQALEVALRLANATQ